VQTTPSTTSEASPSSRGQLVRRRGDRGGQQRERGDAEARADRAERVEVRQPALDDERRGRVADGGDEDQDGA
jgi:hypothetical protein